MQSKNRSGGTAGKQGSKSAGSSEEKGSRDAESKGKKLFKIDIFRDWCKSCGICAAFCPRECIRLSDEGNPVVSDPDRCTGCGWCELHCPDFAISVHEKESKAQARDA